MEKTILSVVFLLAGGTLLPVSTLGQDTTVVISSFDALWGQVLKNNPTERVYELNIRKAGEDRAASRSFLYPNVSGSFNGQDNLSLAITPVPGELVGRPGTTYNVQFGKHYTYGTGFGASESIFDWTSVFQSRIAGNGILLNQAQAAVYEQTLKEQTARYYYAVLVASSSLKVAKSDQGLADSLVQVAQKLLNEGVTDAIALNQAKINYNDVTQNLAQSRQLYDQGMANLKILLGKPAGASIVLADSLDIRLEQNGIALSIAPDRNLEVYRRQLTAAVLDRKQKLAAFYPSLSLDGYYGVQQYQNDFGLSFKSGAWSNYSYIGMSLNVPLFTGFANQQRLKSSATSLHIAEIQYESASLQSQVNDDLLLKQYGNYLQMTHASRENFVLYGDNLELARQKFAEGLLATDAYLKVFEDYLGAENTYLNNLSNVYSTQATILARN